MVSYSLVFGDPDKRIGNILTEAQIRSLNELIEKKGVIYSPEDKVQGLCCFLVKGAVVTGYLSYGKSDALDIFFVESRKKERESFRLFSKGKSIGLFLIISALKKHNLRKVSWSSLTPSGERLYARALEKNIANRVNDDTCILRKEPPKRLKIIPK